jgi:hypothetical protein
VCVCVCVCVCGVCVCVCVVCVCVCVCAARPAEKHIKLLLLEPGKQHGGAAVAYRRVVGVFAPAERLVIAQRGTRRSCKQSVCISQPERQVETTLRCRVPVVAGS